MGPDSGQLRPLVVILLWASLAAAQLCPNCLLCPPPYPTWDVDPAMINHTTTTPLYEPPINLLNGQFYTPNNYFFIRCHVGEPPEVNACDHYLNVSGPGMLGLSVNVFEIQTLFSQITQTTSIQCAGNRRSEMAKVKPVSGTLWGGGAIGTATWTGAPLKDILTAAGFNPSAYDDPGSLHLILQGSDFNSTSGENFQISVPMWIILNPAYEPMVAYQMNGVDIPLTHGYPLRAIMPGLVGVRNVKWLTSITVSTTESQSPWQQQQYRVYDPNTNAGNVVFDSAPPIYNLPVNSYITSHTNGENVTAGAVTISGYAWSGGGRSIVRVLLSQDGGNTWQKTNITNQGPFNGQDLNWSWALWEIPVTLPSGAVNIMINAVDTDYQHQDKYMADVWDYLGYLSYTYQNITLNAS